MENKLQNFSDILSALDAVRNLKALVLVIGGFIGAVVVTSAGVATGAPSAIALFGVIGMLLVLFGINAAGIVLTCEATGREAPGYTEAVTGGIGSFLKIIVVFLLLLALLLGYTLAASILLLLCKIPGIGALLYAIVLPVLILLSGAVYIAALFCGSLALPAIWQGDSVLEAVKTAISIAVQRLIEVVVRFMLLGLLMFLVMGIIAMIIGSGLIYSLGLSTAILSSGHAAYAGYGPGAGMGMFGGFMQGGSSGLLLAGGFGIGVVQALAAGIVTCIGLAGLIRTYLVLSEGVDTARVGELLSKGQQELRRQKARVEAEIRHQKDEMERRRKEKEQAAKDAAQTARDAEPAPEHPAPPPDETAPAPGSAATGKVVCPKCGADILAGDAFCGSCGNKLP